MAVISRVKDAYGEVIPGLLQAWCPGCREHHQIIVMGWKGSQRVWAWNGSLEKPTFSPSILVRKDWGPDTELHRRCHSYIRYGQWQFLSDCTHDLAGKMIPMTREPD